MQKDCKHFVKISAISYIPTAVFLSLKRIIFVYFVDILLPKCIIKVC